jgi:FKBP-type peptidyl-prolyl cis-trans isomerase
MKKIKNYKDFINETKKLTNKQIKVVESRISDEYSKNFWVLALKSKVFNNDEKKMIQENLVHVEMNLNLINEKSLFGYLSDAGAYLYGLGEKAWNWFCKKIEYIRKGISSLIRGVKAFFMKLFYGAIDKIWAMASKKTDESKIDELVEEAKKQDRQKLRGELWVVEDMIKWWMGSKTSEKNLENINKKTEEGIKKAEDKAEEALQQAQKELDEDNDEFVSKAEEKQNENADILYTFYSYQMIVEGGGGEKKSYVTIFLNFVSDIFGGKDFPEEDKDGKPVKLGKKLMWFMKLIFRIFIQVLSPVTLLIKAYIKTVGKFLLNGLGSTV